MKRKPDWADRRAESLLEYCSVSDRTKDVSRALRAAFRRGAKAEREACLKIIKRNWPDAKEEARVSGDACITLAMEDVSDQIRARGKR